MNRTHVLALMLALACNASAAASAQSYALRSDAAYPASTAQTSFYNPGRDELVMISVDGTVSQAYDSNGNVIRPAAPLPVALGDLVDGGAFDVVLGVGLVMRQRCELIELDPVALTVISRRTLAGAPLVPAPTLCAALDVGSDGSIYVADYASSRVVVYPRVGTVPVRAFGVALGELDNLAHIPGTDRLMAANSTDGLVAIYQESGALVSGPSPLGTGIILGTHTRANTAGLDGMTFFGAAARLWFCDHNHPVAFCYVQQRACTGAADCPAPFLGCDVGTGVCLSATCGDGNIEGDEACDDGDRTGGDVCSATCRVETGFVCTGEPSVCVGCLDTSAAGTDSGCTAASPHCRTVGVGAPSCEACIDDSVLGTDLGCASGAPRCVSNLAGVFACVGCSADADCVDTNDCTIDGCSAGACTRTSAARGTVCTTGVCSGPGSDLCVECVDDTQCDAGERCDASTSTCASRPDAAMSLPDAFVSEPDAFVLEPDASVPVDVDAGPRSDAGRPDAARPDAASAPIDAAVGDIDAAVVGGTFVGGAVCSASPSRTGSTLTWSLLALALSSWIIRRRAR